ncbi:MAG: CPBP family intramembrane metalloprotease [Acidobacteria bacterium]|nr:CPBP family intramembrane metalloprotease [Acidobacteriota bacterium]
MKPEWGWKEALASVGLMGPSLLAGTILAYAAGYLVHGKAPSSLQLAVPSQVFSYACWLVCIWLLFKVKGLSAPRELELGWPGGPAVLQYLALGPALTLGVGVLGNLLKANDLNVNLIKDILADPIARPMLLLFGVTIGPLVEEMLFRGILLPVAARTLGVAGALLLTSVPFALIHGPQYSWSWQHLVLLVGVSVAFGVVRLRSGSTMASTLTHGAYNLMMFAGYFITHKDPQL